MLGVIVATVGTLVVTIQNIIMTTQRTLRNVQAMPYIRETTVSFFSVCGYQKLNIFNEGNLVFADVHLTCDNSKTPHTQLLTTIHL